MLLGASCVWAKLLSLATSSNSPHTRIALLLEAIALRHQIAVLERSRTRRPCLRRISAALGLAVALVAAMAREPNDCPARDRLALAP